MTGAEYRELLNYLGMSQSEAGRFFGRTSLTGRIWASDKGPPESVAMLLRLSFRLRMNKNMLLDYSKPLVRGPMPSKLDKVCSLAADEPTPKDRK